MADAPWNPDDAFDAMAETFRRQIVRMAVDADKIAIYRDLDAKQQIACFMVGALTGAVSVCLESVNPESHDAMMKALADYLPVAREFVDATRKLAESR